MTFEEIKSSLLGLSALEHNWDSYGADAPNDYSIDTAIGFVGYFNELGILPKRVKPSVVGGIGITFYQDNRKVYVEISNSKLIYALFSDGVSEPEVTKVNDYGAFYNRIIDYFRENHD